MASRFLGRVRLHLPARLTMRWWKAGARRFGGELEEMQGFVVYGSSLREIMEELTALLAGRTSASRSRQLASRNE